MYVWRNILSKMRLIPPLKSQLLPASASIATETNEPIACRSAERLFSFEWLPLCSIRAPGGRR